MAGQSGAPLSSQTGQQPNNPTLMNNMQPLSPNPFNSTTTSNITSAQNMQGSMLQAPKPSVGLGSLPAFLKGNPSQSSSQIGGK